MRLGTDGLPGGASRQYKVLVVDDERPVGELIQDVLRRSGCQVELSSGGEESLRLAVEGDHDLVISDFSIPGLNGLEFARRFGLARPGTGVLIVSACLDPETMEALERQPNVLGLVRKPFDIFELVDRVRGCLEGDESLLARAHRLRMET
ncbi:MAG: response regulator [Planctomycetota bacterium]